MSSSFKFKQTLEPITEQESEKVSGEAVSVIIVENLSKSFRTFDRREGVLGSVKDLFHREYRELRAVDSISFRVEPGELVGYIGPNGAGKSTSIKMLTGILKPTSGEISVLGYHPFKDRKSYVNHIGVVFGQRTQLWWDIAVIESLKLLKSIYQVSEADYEYRMKILREILGLDEFLHTPVRKLSLGQRIRSDLAASLIHQPQVLFLDEPTIGLDAVAKESVRNFLKHINREFGTTIILTTHDLKEIEALCQRMMILDHGKVVYDGSLTKIKSLPGLEREIQVELTGEVSIDELERCVGTDVRVTKDQNGRVHLRFAQDKIAGVEVTKRVLEKFSIRDLTVEDPDIEEVIRKVYREGV